jgi:hypothetical protein
MATPGHFTRIRASDSAWVANGAVYYHEFQQIDRNLADCLHEGGGTFSLASTLLFGGTYGIAFAAGTPLSSLGPVYFDGSFTVGSLLTADIVATFNSRTTARFYGPITASGVNSFTSGFTAGASTFTDDLTIGVAGKTCTVNGLLDAKGNVNLGDTTGDIVSVKGTTQLDGPVTTKQISLGYTPGSTGNPANITGDLVMNGGRIVEDIVDTGDNDLSGQVYHRFFVFRGVTQPRYLTITISNPRPGTAFYVNSSSTIVNASVSLTINGVGAGTVEHQTRMFYYNGSTWVNIEV